MPKKGKKSRAKPLAAAGDAPPVDQARIDETAESLRKLGTEIVRISLDMESCVPNIGRRQYLAAVTKLKR